MTALATAASRCIVQDFASLTPRRRELQRAREDYLQDLTTAWHGAGKEDAQQAFDLLVAAIENHAELPPGQCIPRGGKIDNGPEQPGHCANLLVP